MVYFNIIRSLKQILETLAAYDDIDDGSDTVESHEEVEDDASIIDHGKRSNWVSAFSNSTASTSSTGSPHVHNTHSPRPSRPPTAQSFINSTHGQYSTNLHLEPSAHQIANLRLRLSPLTSSDEQLARRLNCGIAPTKEGEVFVRNGWQTRTVENGGLLKGRRLKRKDKAADTVRDCATEEDPLLDEVGAMLDMSKEDIADLWEHPTVVALIAKRKLKLDEWSEL